MLFSDLLRTATLGVTVNKGRSLLTMLGIIIGVGAVVLMTGVGRSMESVILGQIDVLGPKTLALWPGKSGPEGGAAALQSDFDAIKMGDVQALTELSTIADIAPIMFVPGEARYGRERTNPRVVGSTPEYYSSQNIEVVQGRFHDAEDERARRAVAVIGPDIVDDLFYGGSALGKRIDIGDKIYTVIGVLKPVGTQFFQNVDDRIIIPFSVAQSITQRDYLDMVTFQAVGSTQIAQQDVESLLRQRHRIVPPEGDDPAENDDFLVRTAQQAQDILGAVSLGLTLFITMVAGISLVVGGIGIMNIMLVAVSERTREIGLRKAIGAKGRDILYQFLIESVYVTLIGGAIGVSIGLFLSYIVSLIVRDFLVRYTFTVSLGSIIVALCMAAGTGLIFGIYPAKRASQLSPIEALRYE
ncbi:MAG: ABC transporter permease [Candidatus Peribacteraceae bacterium]|nr:ABC transporter permease [Candidatus Peribacteraceae bacterium]